MALWIRVSLLVLAAVAVAGTRESREDALASNLASREASLLERLKAMLHVPEPVSLAQTSDSITSASASKAETSDAALVPLPEESLGDVYFRGQLRAQEEAKQKQEQLMQKRAHEAALAAAQQQAYIDAMAFQQQAVLLQQAAEQYRHSHRHRRHRHRRSHHKKQAATAPSFFQQYYAMQQNEAMPSNAAALGAYAVPQPGTALPQPEAQQPQPQQPTVVAPTAAAPAVAEPRFLEMPAQQQQQAAVPPQPQKPAVSYADPFNNARFVQQGAVAERPSGSAYGMPQPAPVQEAATLMSNTVAAMARPVMSSATLNMNQRIAAPQLPRFREAAAHTTMVGNADNPNPSGVPMPFYSPNQAPPPAPNQLPSSSALVRGVFPLEMQQATTVGVRPAIGNTAGLNTAAINFSPLGVHADINAYPFNSFLEVEHVSTTSRRRVKS